MTDSTTPHPVKPPVPVFQPPALPVRHELDALNALVLGDRRGELLPADYSDDATARRFEAVDVRDSDHEAERGQQ